jgi:hypothetical protein
MIMNHKIFISLTGLICPIFTSAKTPGFQNDVIPAITKAGCNTGDCHGAGRGQDGFRLSLFGYDIPGDHYRIVNELPGRRINLAVPEKSLLIQKAIGAVPHTGGERMKVGSAPYNLLLGWIEAGALDDPPGTPSPEGITFQATSHKFDKPGLTLQTQVIATYSDGTQRDVTQWCLYKNANESIAAIDAKGFIQAKKSGGSHVFARFDKFSVALGITVLPEESIDWPETPENNYIDTLAFAKLKDLQIPPSGLCSDEQFLRRATLDLTGKLPTPEEYHAFMVSENPKKREFVIDQLLSRQSFGELMAAKWGEWLRIYTDTNPGSGTAMLAGWNYYHWVKEQMVENTPINQFAKALVTGNGSNLSNPPSNYYTMLPQGHINPVRLSEDTAQIFLGVRTQCAQCHNHPFDRWTMDDYYAFQSFFMGVKRKHGAEAREYFTYVDIEAEPAKHLTDGRPMPHKFLGGPVADVKDKDPRKVLADWMAAPNNRMFRENIANRIWAHFFGRGIIDPVDDIQISNPPSNGALLREIGRKLAEDYAYDQKKLIRDICLSRTYQLSATATEANKDDEMFFSHAKLRRLRADVLFDVISQAMDYKHQFRRSSAERAVNMFEGGRRDSFNDYFFQTFGQARRESVCACEDRKEATLSQTLHLINGRTTDFPFSHSPVLIPRLTKAHPDAPEAVIRKLYIRSLTREPTDDELQKLVAMKPGGNDQRQLMQYYQNVIWALVNSSEFLFNH